MGEPVIQSKEIKLIPIDQLKIKPNNRNKHSKEQIKELARHFTVQGFRNPIIVSNQSGEIVCGHGRFEAAKLAGLNELPVIFQDFDTPESEYSYAVADNGLALWAELDLSGINSDIGDLGPDFNIADLGIKDFVLEPADKIAGCDEDEVPEHVEPKAKLGDIYQLGDHRLMCGDSTNIQHVEALMNGQKAELCFTSPPYSDQREYRGDIELSTEYLAKFISSSFGMVKYFCVNLGYARKNGEVFEYWNDYLKEAKNSGLKLLSWNVWDKGECGSIGNQTAMFGISHEWIFVFGLNPKELNRTIKNKSAGELANHNGNRQKDGTIKKQKDRIVGTFSQLKTIYSCVPQKERDDIDHPARFPVRFPEGYIEALTTTHDIVYEPFCGSGTTLIASEKLSRKCYAMEIDPHYIDVIIARWEKYSGKKAELLNG